MGSVLAQKCDVDLLAAGGTGLRVEQVLHAALSVQDVRAGQADDVGRGLDVHEAGHAAWFRRWVHVLGEVLVFAVV